MFVLDMRLMDVFGNGIDFCGLVTVVAGIVDIVVDVILALVMLCDFLNAEF